MNRNFFCLTFFIKKFLQLLFSINLHKSVFFLYRLMILLNRKNAHLYFDYAYFLMKNKKYSEIISIYKKALNFVEKKFHPKLNLEIGLTYFNFIKTDNNDEKYYLSQSYLLKDFDNSINQIIYPPKFLLTKIDYDQKIIDKIYAFEKTNPSSTKSKINFDLTSHYNKITGSFQSHHNIHQDKEFNEFYINLEKLLNKTINEYFAGQKHYLKIKKMWFLITRKGGAVDRHTHSADLTGVVYIKIARKDEKANLFMENPQQNLELINFKDNPNTPKISFINSESFKFKPENHDLIIFNSYLNHMVISSDAENEDRISLAWDADFV